MAECGECSGTGRVRDGSPGCPPQGLLCMRCDGTGDDRQAQLLRAYRAGYAAGLQAMRDAMPQSGDPGLRLAEVLSPREGNGAL